MMSSNSNLSWMKELVPSAAPRTISVLACWCMCVCVCVCVYVEWHDTCTISQVALHLETMLSVLVVRYGDALHTTLQYSPSSDHQRLQDRPTCWLESWQRR